MMAVLLYTYEYKYKYILEYIDAHTNIHIDSVCSLPFSLFYSLPPHLCCFYYFIVEWAGTANLLCVNDTHNEQYGKVTWEAHVHCTYYIWFKWMNVDEKKNYDFDREMERTTDDVEKRQSNACMCTNRERKHALYTTAPKVGRHRIQNEEKPVRNIRAYVCIFVRHILYFFSFFSRFSFSHFIHFCSNFCFSVFFFHYLLYRRIRYMHMYGYMYYVYLCIVHKPCALCLLLTFIVVSCCCLR